MTSWCSALASPSLTPLDRDLGVVIDRELSLAAHVTAVCRSGYNQLRQLRPVVEVVVVVEMNII